MTRPKPFENADVAAVFETYPKAVKTKLLFLRQLIFDVASATDGVGALEETLRWGQPSYLTTQSNSGSLVRIDRIKSREGSYAIYFHCQTSLIETFKHVYRDRFKFEGNRSIVFDHTDVIPIQELSHCISLALTYRLERSSKKRTAPWRQAHRTKPFERTTMRRNSNEKEKTRRRFP